MVSARSLRLWHGLQAQGSRSAVATAAFHQEQANFKSIEPLKTNFALPRQVAALQECGFYSLQGNAFTREHPA
eukprot:9515783-Prorocentrum_lima.AAC.1